MAKLLKTARQLIEIAEFCRDRFGVYYADGQLYDFDQTWASTALGFGGVGGAALTTERTYVFIPNSLEDEAFVFFGGTYAYTANLTDAFWEDIEKKDMAKVKESGKYMRYRK